MSPKPRSPPKIRLYPVRERMKTDLERKNQIGNMMEMVESPGRGFSGELGGIQLTDLVQLCCLAQLSHLISVKSSSGFGIIHVHSGQVCHSETGALAGESAFFNMFSWKRGSFEVIPCPEDNRLKSISRNWEFLLIEAMRLRDATVTSDDSDDNANQAECRGEEGFSGTFQEIQLLDIIQLMCMAKVDRSLEVRSGESTGVILTRDGQVYHSAVGDLTGEDAFIHILKADSGEFFSSSVAEEVTATINKPWEYLLMDAVRFRDEAHGTGGEDDEEAGRNIQSLFQRIQRMKVTEKIRLAMTGDKEARNFLVRDSNRLVQFAIISNPRISEGEVAAIACSRNVDEDVLRRIANNREWTKLYPIRLALSTNPKTPVPIATKLVATLITKDLKQIAKSKSVATAVAQTARRLLPEKG